MFQQIRSQLSSIALVSSISVLAACSGGSSEPEAQKASIEQTSITTDTPFVYIERSMAEEVSANLEKLSLALEDGDRTPLDVFSPYDFNPGAKLLLRSSLDVDGVSTDILKDYFQSSSYDVKDLSMSFDGKSMVFAAHGPVGHPTDYSWNIYEYDFVSNTVRRVIADNTLANAGQDTNPAYGPYNVIVFSTDRAAGNPNNPPEQGGVGEEKADCYKVGSNEKPSLLHSMSYKGENIVQLTYGNHHDTQTTTLSDGQVAFLRWSRSYELLHQCEDPAVQQSKLTVEDLFKSDYPTGMNAPADWEADAICAYTIETPFGPALASNHYTVLRIKGDGSNLQQLYETVTTSASDESLLQIQDMVQSESGSLVALLEHRYNQFVGGNIMELMEPTAPREDVVFANMSLKPVVSDSVSLFPNQVSVAGWFSAVAPYRDGSSRLLVSWSQCKTVDGGVSSFCETGDSADTVNNSYGIWVYDPATDSRLPIVRAKSGVEFSELAMSQPLGNRGFPYQPFNADYAPDVDDSRIICDDPSVQPTPEPSTEPTPTPVPTVSPTVVPTPGVTPTPEVTPTPVLPPVTPVPTVTPTPVVTPTPTGAPTPVPSGEPTPVPTVSPSGEPTPVPTTSPSGEPTPTPTPVPTSGPSGEPTPTPVPTTDPSVEPTVVPTVEPTVMPTVEPTVVPTPTPVPNTPPVADAGDDQPVTIGQSVMLDGSGSSDADGDALTYSWTVISPASEAGTQLLSDSTGAMPHLVPTVHETYVVQLVVNDGTDSSAPDTVSLVVGNTAPIADAGDDATAGPGDTVTLDGSGSTDVDGDSLSYSWTIVEMPVGSAVALAGESSVAPSFTLDALGEYHIQLIVNDGIDSSEADLVVINSTNTAPVAVAGDDQAVDVGSIAQLNGSASYDADGDALTYSWSLISAPTGSSAAVSDSGAEMPSVSVDLAGSYVIQLVVNDGLASSVPDTVVLTTNNVRPIADAGADRSMNTGDEVTLDGSGSHDPDGDKLTYSWSLVSQPDGSAVSLSGYDTVSPMLTVTHAGSYIAQLVVSDGEYDSAPDTVIISVAAAPSCDMSGTNTRMFPVVIRDFKQSHPDFEYELGDDRGIVQVQLGMDSKPVYAHGEVGTLTTNGETEFNQWYNDVEGINIRIPMSLEMKRVSNTDVWTYENSNFFPIDDMGWGNSPKMPHNYHFTLESHLVFDYEGGEQFTFRGDDDLWLFINGKRVIDIGGVHEVEKQTVSLDELAAELGIEVGQRYSFDLFFAERHTVKSNFMFQTSIMLECDNNHSGHGDDTNPGEGGGTDNTSNQGTDNPNNAGK